MSASDPSGRQPRFGYPRIGDAVTDQSPGVSVILSPVLRHAHGVVAIACYLACFFFPALYVNDDFEPQSSLALLMIGWAGALELNFVWFANPALAVAVCLARSRARTSLVLAGIALLLALSLPLYGYVRAHEISSQSPITAYGWGYALWVTSMAWFAAGQLARVVGMRDGLVASAALLGGSLAIAAYGTYLRSGAGGLQAHTKERDRVFKASCHGTGLRVDRRAQDVHSVFLDPDSAWTIEPRSRGTPERKYRSRGEIMRDDFLRGGKLDFVETPAPDGTKGYVRFAPGAFAGVPVPHLQARYAVVTRPQEFPFHLGLQGETVLVRDRRDDSLLASATYILDSQTGRYCGPPGDTFSTRAFVADVLGL